MSNKRAALEDWLDNEIMPWFADRMLPVSLAVAEKWVNYQPTSRRRDAPIVDAVLAATALTHDLIIVTHP